MIVGIDLGTTNSEVAVVRDGRVVVLEEQGTAILPSCVGLAPDGRLIVGVEARNQYAVRPDATVRSIKRKMGSADTVQMGEKRYTPPEISAFILRELKGRAERILGVPVTQAVITVPAYFSDAQRQATREAGILAGLDVPRILNEPTAAALAYEAAGVTGAKTILVYDFGGGTFDVSLVKVTGDIVEVCASHGDNHLGGDDIDALLLDHALAELRRRQPAGRPSPLAVNRLRLACERLKIDLSGAATATLAETGLILEDGTVADLAFEYSRRDFEELTEHLFRRTLDSVRNVLGQAGLFASSIDEVLLVGGTTRIPAVLDLLETELGKRPRFSVHPELAVAYGAGVMAARLAGERQQRVLVDVTPYTFGTSCLGHVRGTLGPNLFVPIIKAGTPLPARRGQVFYTMAEGQEAVNVEVFQGESEDARENVFVGEFRVAGLDEEADAGSPILLNMQLDLDGLLTATAVEQHTGLSKSVVLKNTLHQPDRKELEASRRKIAELFPAQRALEAPTAEDGDVSLVEATGGGAAAGSAPAAPKADEAADQAGDGLDPELRRRVETCRERLDTVDRADLEKQLAALAAAVLATDEVATCRAREAIEDILFYVE